jgi:SAM-dependent methyltransferase
MSARAAGHHKSPPDRGARGKFTRDGGTASEPTGNRILVGLGASLEREYPLVPRYTKYAGSYDDLGQEQFAIYLLALVETVIQRHRLPVRTIVDVPCGTAAASIVLARKGYRVTGVDGSAEMLRIARQKAEDAGVEVQLCQQDMTRLRLDLTADLILSLYDSVNYLLTIEDLEAAFQGVAAALNPDGLFIFDVNTVRCLETEWGNQVMEERSKLSTLIHLYSYEPETRIGTLELVGVRLGPDGIERFREIHRERGYRYAEVVGALGRRGLEVLEAYSFPELSAPDDSASRLIFVARHANTKTRRHEETHHSSLITHHSPPEGAP